jgi:hypothetical protein
MSNAIVVIGPTKVLTPAAGTTANVGNVATRSTTFHVANPSTTVNAYVGIFNNYADAIAMDHPTVGSDAGGLIITPGESMIIEGNFGASSLGPNANVYVAAITATGTASIFFTPVSENSTPY